MDIDVPEWVRFNPSFDMWIAVYCSGAFIRRQMLKKCMAINSTADKLYCMAMMPDRAPGRARYGLESGCRPGNRPQRIQERKRPQILSVSEPLRDSADGHPAGIWTPRLQTRFGPSEGGWMP